MEIICLDAVEWNAVGSLTFSAVEYSRFLEGADAGVHQLQAGGQLVFNVLLSVRCKGKKKGISRLRNLSQGFDGPA